MAFRKLDDKGNPIPKKGRSKRLPAEKKEHGQTLFHYQVKVSIKQQDGKYKQILRHKWLPDDIAAEEYQRQLLHKAPVNALTWEQAHKLWVEGNIGKFSDGHISNSKTTMKQWYEAFGTNSTIETTTLAAFSEWIDELARKGTGRAAQIKRGHLLAIARWCRERGLIVDIPFEHSPKPTSREKKVRPATIEEFYKIADLLPAHQSLLWQLLGVTGMRLGAACNLREADIGKHDFTVLTKGRKRETYPITGPVDDIIKKARKWKAKHKFSKCPYLFCNLVGNRWTSTTFGRYVKKVCGKKENKLSGITPHQLRHLAGTILGEENLSVNIIMAGLGHADQKSSHIYVDKTAGMRAKAMDVLIQNLYKNNPKRPLDIVDVDCSKLGKTGENVEITCPCCERKFLIRQKIKPQAH